MQALKPHFPLSQFFTYAEAVASQTAARHGIDNTPPPDVLQRIYDTAQRMDTLRMLLGAPIIVTSWYRCLELNRMIGSKDSSQHVQGVAVDFVSPRYGSTQQIVDRLKNDGVQYDQLILEFPRSPSGGWVHVSFANPPRMQALLIDRDGATALA